MTPKSSLIRDPRLISRIELHAISRCKWLVDRREISMLGLMYKQSRVPDMLVAPRRVLRSNAKLKLKLQRPEGQHYRDSPLYRGAIMWYRLEPAEQKLATYDLFMNKIKNN